MHPLTFVGGSIEAIARLVARRADAACIRSRSWAAPLKRVDARCDRDSRATEHPLTFVGGSIEASNSPSSVARVALRIRSRSWAAPLKPDRRCAIDACVPCASAHVRGRLH